MTYRITEELRPTDALCQRWARLTWDRPVWGASPIYRGMLTRAGVTLYGGTEPPLPDEVTTLDRIIAAADAAVKALLTVWYVHGGSSEQKAKRLGICRRSLYNRHNANLIYLRSRLRATGVKV